jgi:hypothetical protein
LHRSFDAVGAQVDEEFVTDAAGHALSGEPPIDADCTLKEIAPTSGVQGAAPVPFRLESDREVIRVVNTIVPGAAATPLGELHLGQAVLLTELDDLAAPPACSRPRSQPQELMPCQDPVPA